MEGGAFTLATFDGDVRPVTRASHTSQYETKINIGCLPKAWQLPRDKSAPRLLYFDKSKSERQTGANSLRSGSYLPIVLRASTNWTSERVPRLLLWNNNTGYLPKVLAIAEGRSDIRLL